MHRRYLVVLPLLLLSHAGVVYLAGRSPSVNGPRPAGGASAGMAGARAATPVDLLRMAEAGGKDEQARREAARSYERPDDPGFKGRIEEIEARVAVGSSLEDIVGCLTDGVGPRNVPIMDWAETNPQAAWQFYLRYCQYPSLGCDIFLDKVFEGDVAAMLSAASVSAGPENLLAVKKTAVVAMAARDFRQAITFVASESWPQARKALAGELFQDLQADHDPAVLLEALAAISDPAARADILAVIAGKLAPKSPGDDDIGRWWTRIGENVQAGRAGPAVRDEFAAILARAREPGIDTIMKDPDFLKLSPEAQLERLRSACAQPEVLSGDPETSAQSYWGWVQWDDGGRLNRSNLRKAARLGPEGVERVIKEAEKTYDRIPRRLWNWLKADIIESMASENFDAVVGYLENSGGPKAVFETVRFRLDSKVEGLARLARMPEPSNPAQREAFGHVVEELEDFTCVEPEWIEQQASRMPPGHKRDALYAALANCWRQESDPERAEALTRKVVDRRILDPQGEEEP